MSAVGVTSCSRDVGNRIYEWIIPPAFSDRVRLANHRTQRLEYASVKVVITAASEKRISHRICCAA